MQVIVAAKAGRCDQRAADPKWVDPLPEKGHIEVGVDEDGELVHFKWFSYDSMTYGDGLELIIFPGEATFEKVAADTSGRTHVLKFNSSSQMHFFWFQDANSAIDSNNASNINQLLANPSFRPVPTAAPSGEAAHNHGPREGESLQAPGAPLLSEPSLAPAAAPASTSGAASSSSAAPGQDLNQSDLARFLLQAARQGGLFDRGQADTDVHLTDVLSTSTISNLVTAHPEVIPSVRALLPPGINLPENPTPEQIIPCLSAPQFREVISDLDSALRGGGLPGPMMRELGLPESAGRSVQAFLDGLRSLASQEGASAAQNQGGSDSMETD